MRAPALAAAAAAAGAAAPADARACNFTQYLKSYDPAKAFNGYTLLGPGSQNPEGSRIYLIDMNGSVVHHWDPQQDAGCFPGVHLQTDGNLLRTYCPSGGIEGGGVARIAWDGSVVWDYQNPNIHHDTIFLPNGNVMTPFLDVKTKEEVAAAGGESNNARNSDGIIEVKPTGANTGEIVWKWLFWDHLVQSKSADMPNYVADVGTSPERMDVNCGNTAGVNAAKGGVAMPPGSDGDWCHMNAIDYNPELDQVAFSCRQFSEVFIIDHSTTTAEAATSSGGRSAKGGDFLWRWGNPANYKRGEKADQLFDGQHDVHWLRSDVPARSVTGSEAANTIMVFDNINKTMGDCGTEHGARSSVAVVQLPAPDATTGCYASPANGTFLPSGVDSSWSMDGFVANHISGAQRLSNGNTHVTNGETGQLVEVTPDGEVVWEWYWNGTACHSGSASPIPGKCKPSGNCFFRTYRFPASYPGLKGRDLSTPVECE